MKKEQSGVCPGCKRRCQADALRCKYGRAYFAKMAAQQYEYKWEAYTEKGGLAWRLLLTGRRVKKALRKGRATEAEVFSALTAQEQETLSALLSKLHFCEKNGE